MKFLVLVIFASASAFALTPEEQSFERTCAGQIMSAVASVHEAKGSTYKKIIFSKTVDQSFVENFNKLKEVALKYQETKDKALTTKMAEYLGAAVDLSKKNAKKEFDLCTKYMAALTSESKKICKDVKENDPAIQEKYNKCAQSASKMASVKTPEENWKKAISSLVIAKK